LQQFADRQIAPGKYTSLDEMILAGLQILAEQEQIFPLLSLLLEKFITNPRSRLPAWNGGSEALP
jgi:hypothetical protein